MKPKGLFSICMALVLLLSLVGCDSVRDISLIDEDIHTDHAGVYLTLSSADSSGEYETLTVVWHNETEREITFGEGYYIEMLEKNEWMSVLTEDMPVPGIALLLPAHSTQEKTYSARCFDLSREGTYRIRCEFYPGDGQTCSTYAMFEIKQTSPKKHRLTVDDHADILIERVDGRYAAGETVTVKTHILMDAYLELSLNGEVLDLMGTAVDGADGSYSHWEFYITMPDEDAVLTYEITDGFSVEPTQPGGTDVHDAFDVRVSSSGWLNDTTVCEGCLNPDQIALSGVRHLPLHKFSSRAELDAFKARFDQDINGDDFDRNTADYDDAFFGENHLFLIYISANSGSYRYDINSVSNDGQCFCIYAYQTNSPEELTCDMAGWFVTVAVPRSATESCTVFDAVMGYPQ